MVGAAWKSQPVRAVHDAMLRTMDLVDLEPGGIRRITRREFRQMGELGMFENQRVELLRGLVVQMTGMNRAHRQMMIWLNRRLIESLDMRWFVRPAIPYAASDDSEPEPDLMITQEADTTEDGPRSALLVIEIADTSLRKDRRVKLSIYAEAGVCEYWIVNVSEPGTVSVEVYAEPTGSTYARQEVLRDGDTLRPTKVPLEIPVAELPR
jgi:Uma2 family endonuclease